MIRKILLGGASCLAILGVAGEASASIGFVAFIDTTPGVSSFTAPTTGSYAISVWGAQGGAGYSGYTTGGGATFAGGLGYGQRSTFHLIAGETVNLYVGAKGGDAITGSIPGGGGGGGASAVLLGAAGLVSGGGGGGGKYGVGYNGQVFSVGGAGGAGGGSAGGQGGTVGSPGGYSTTGAPGGGLGTASPPGPYAGRGFFDGGAGGSGLAAGGAGGSGFAGGGGGFFGGGGGGGFSGGGGGAKYGGGGGGSYASGGSGRTALAFHAGNGEIEISVPEPSTWAMMLGGFGFTGYVLRRRVTRRRMMRPA